MKSLVIILAQSNTGAVALIIALLLVSAVIGYFTAWYYAKSVYTPVIKGLETEKADLLKQVAGLQDEITVLKGKMDGLNEKIDVLQTEIAEKEKEVSLMKSKIMEP